MGRAAALILLLAVIGGGGGAAWWRWDGEWPNLVPTTPRVALPLPARGGPERAEGRLMSPPPKTAAQPVADIPQPTAPVDAAAPPQTLEAAAPAEPEAAMPEALAPPPAVADIPVPRQPRHDEALPPPSYAALPPVPAAPPLAKAPVPELVRKIAKGNIPAIAADGRQPWQVYARPFIPPPQRPLVAVVVAGLGLDGAATEAAIARMPAAVTLSFSPYARDLGRWLAKARAAGHEVMLDLPLQPPGYPVDDPGPAAVLAEASAPTAVDKLESLLVRGEGYTGVVAIPGSPAATAESGQAVLAVLKDRGLAYLGGRPELGASAARPAFAVVGRVLDEEPFRDAIDARLAQVKALAVAQGSAVAVTRPSPAAFDRISRWLAGLAAEEPALAPVSALMRPGT